MKNCMFCLQIFVADSEFRFLFNLDGEIREVKRHQRKLPGMAGEDSKT